MSDAAKRNARNRSAGKAWERDIEQGARALGLARTAKRGEFTPEERLARRTPPADGDRCREWQGKRNERGYGRFWLRGRWVLAHRAAFELAWGGLPAGLVVRHRCDNPPCVNLEHLELGTHADNMRDMAERNRRKGIATVWGERHGRSKLTRAQVEEIRSRRDAGVLLADLAGAFDVSKQHVSKICRREKWAA
ncbi:MAG: HNH endonuclease [Phycicoccus sp.]